MSCSWSLPIRLLTTNTSKLEKNDVPGAAKTTPSKPRGNSSKVDLSSLLVSVADVDEAASTGNGSIGSSSFPGPLAPELLALSTGGGLGMICEPFPEEPIRPPAPSTDGGGGTTSEPAPGIERNRPSPAALPPCADGGGGTTFGPAPVNEVIRPA